MPHAVDEEDDGLRDFLDGEEDLSQIPDLNDINDRELDTGEKANDAQDYGDISDEDLAEDEPELDPIAAQASGDTELDDLFGDGDLGSPTDPINGEITSFDDTQLVQDYIEQPDLLNIDSEDEDEEAREQRLLFEQAQLDRDERQRRTDTYGEPPPPPVTDAELFSAVWPQFEPDKPPRFGDLLPGKKAYYQGKKPMKKPKPLHLSKVTLEIQQDQEKSFKLPAPPGQSFHARQAEASARGIILLLDTEPTPENSENDEDVRALDTAPLGGVTWEDLVALCQDWDVVNGDLNSLDEDFGMRNGDSVFAASDYYDDIEGSRLSKQPKRVHEEGLQMLSTMDDLNIAIETPEKATAKLAKMVYLDLNDPHMLVDVQQPTTSPSHKRKFKRDAVGGLTKDLASRYNLSNDDAYELLKENHQSRIRSLVGNVKIEHALPAVKLQYPFYKVSLSRAEARSWHRPGLVLQSAGYVVFTKPAFHKRKHMRGRAAADLFATSKDLSVADNSTLLLLEYSEEYPAMLSSFGMGSRLINYYRRKDKEDTARPKLDIGETYVLLPQDRSPFSKFGNVDPGQITPTISNEMYRAPVFKHQANQTDFLISRNTTSLEGPKWCLRNIENLHVVGQEFPSVLIPGPGSRLVTNAAKQRHRMFAYRIRKRERVTNDIVIKHNPGWDIGTARTKLREFMNYDKNTMSWTPRGNEADLEESEIRALLKPTDLALLCTMQVGYRQLQDAGYSNTPIDELGVETVETGDQSKSVASIDRLLAPWTISFNFLTASKDGSMVAIHGEGDPTGRGEAFSFIKTSMKGGFRELGESIEDRLDAKKQKDLGGHKYNVAKQSMAYERAIRRVWDAQTRSLSSTVENEDTDIEVDEEGRPLFDRGKTPSSMFGKAKVDDDSVSASVQSRGSSVGQFGKVLRITRRIYNRYGTEEATQELVRDPKVIRQYLKRRRALDIANLSLNEMKRTGDPEKDALRLKIMEKELERLRRNKDRRKVREKAKGIDTAGSPDRGAMSPDNNDESTPGASKRRNVTGMTARKCANCGQVGHIKTNKKLCPTCIYMTTPVNHLPHIRVSPPRSSLLSGYKRSEKNDDGGFGDSAFGSIASSSQIPKMPPNAGADPKIAPLRSSSPPG